MSLSHTNVSCEVHTLMIPTYEVGEPDRNPQFIEHRVYQGSSGKVYPYPVIEKIADKPVDHEWKAVTLRNEYVEVTVLPELGGRIYTARDLTNDYDFVYHNHVIKPALVGLLGPWISGGIEFNWPQHHRPTTYMPVDCDVIELADGGQAVRCHDFDRLSGTEVVTTISLHPGLAALDINARLFNGSDLAQSFLWWANPAVPVNEHTKTIMPPDVHAVMDHGKRDVSRWPIATGTYYKYDYSRGVDISRYKNIPVPTSLMAASSKYDFVGGYDFSRNAGILHVADHHVSPGKKQWTWGNGDFGRAWDRNLTENDGPYVELMTGVYTDNQPDFTWLAPHETKTFTQYFLPYKGVGNVKNANLKAAVNLEIGSTNELFAASETEGVDGAGLASEQARVSVYVTSERKNARVVICQGSDEIFTWAGDLSPRTSFSATTQLKERVSADNLEQLHAAVYSSEGELLVDYRPEPEVMSSIPEPAKPVNKPQEITSVEELVLAGEHLEQYRHATVLPDSYYEEALRREAGNAQANTAIARLMLRRGNWKRAEKYARRAVERLMKHNTNPADCEVLVILGLALLGQGLDDEAYDVLYKATWDGHELSVASYYLAALQAKKGEFTHAEQLARWGLSHDSTDTALRGMLALSVFGALKASGENETVETALRKVVADNLSDNRFDFVTGFVAHFTGIDDEVVELVRRNPSSQLMTTNLLAAARRFADAGLYEEAARVLRYADENVALVHFTCASYLAAHAQNESEHASELGLREDTARELDRREETAREQQLREAIEAEIAAAERVGAGLYWPNTTADFAVLNEVVRLKPDSALAHYFLGCLAYDKHDSKRALSEWQKASELDPTNAQVLRNRAIATVNNYAIAGFDTRERALNFARELMTRAFEADSADARLLFELDQLNQLTHVTPEQRLQLFEQHSELIEQRDDLYVQYVSTLNMTGQSDKALQALLARHFHPWEGGEGKVTGQYVAAHELLACEAFAAQDYQSALDHLFHALHFPDNLGEGKLIIASDNDLHYLLGVTLMKLGRTSEAREQFELATQGLSEVAGAQYYNDLPAQMILFQGLAWRALGQEARARRCFYKLIDFGEQHMNDQVGYDFFAVSLPDFTAIDPDLTGLNHIHCQFVLGMGLLGLTQGERGGEYEAAVLTCQPAHLQAWLLAQPSWREFLGL